MIEYAISPGCLILVSGANGYIGSHIVDILLSKGFRVRGTTRTKKEGLERYFENKYGKGVFETIIFATLDDLDACTQAVNGVSGVVHLVADITFRSDPNEVIPWVKRATLNLLDAASHEPSVKRFVLTSSSSAALIPTPNIPETVTEASWNEVSVKAAWDSSTPAETKGYHVYAAAKVEQERSAWEWVKEQQPNFEFNVVLPNNNYGRILHPEVNTSTMGWVRDILKGDDRVVRTFPPQWFVDVEDTARLHVVALLNSVVKNERIFAFASPFNWGDIFAILKKLRPNNKLIPEPPVNEGRDMTDVVLSKRAEALLLEFFGKRWTHIEESVAHGIEDLE
ncbi:NAD(P)-binding protein [Penicillium nucicola]|uniref:NAD(P)-binding protein n=1 Tax=Penicillium nucicola TaxID=1850975 RepID=UPI00254547C8|nr:NAD(P)-binding protein [Penicillium nucicola]KAJ5762070.1 NAD(P)-binding protein [Penicillium nucicola]